MNRWVSVLVAIVWVGLVGGSASGQSWRVTYQSERPLVLQRLLPLAGGSLLLVGRQDTLLLIDSYLHYYFREGSRILEFRPEGRVSESFNWVPAAEWRANAAGEVFAVHIDVWYCGTPPHSYALRQFYPQLAEPTYTGLVYRPNFAETLPDTLGGDLGGYFPALERSDDWNEARAWLLHPSGRRYVALLDELQRENSPTPQQPFVHYVPLRALRRSLIFDLAAADDSTLILATSSGLMRCDLEGQVRDTLLTGTVIRRLQAVAGGWLAQTPAGLLRLDESLAELARFEPPTGWQLRDWAWGAAGGLVLLRSENRARLVHFEADLQVVNEEELPAELVAAQCVGWLGDEPVVAGTWSLPASDDWPAEVSFSWLARRGTSEAAAVDLALRELKAERVQRRTRDFTFDLLARVANRSPQPLTELGARINVPGHTFARPNWYRYSAKEALVRAGSEEWLHLGRFAVPFGAEPEGLEARVCVEVELPNAHPDANPDDNRLCTRLRLNYTGRPADATSANLHLYPNPASERVVVESAAVGLVVRVFDLAGRSRWVAQTTDSRLEVPVATWPAGLYRVEIETAAGSRSTHKLLVR